MGDTHPRAFVFFSLTHLDKKSDWHFSEEHREQISIILPAFSEAKACRMVRIWYS